MRLHPAAFLVLLPGVGIQNQDDAKSREAFWAQVEELRKASKDNCIEQDDAERVFQSWERGELRRFWEELLKRLEESYRWDIRAMGSLLEGHLDVEFFLEFQMLLVLQGREFFEGVLKDPKSIATKFPVEAPSTRFRLYYLRTAALNVYAKGGAGALNDPQKGREFRKLAGTKWKWRDLKTLYPDLWDRYFLKRDRRPELPDLKSLKDHELTDLAEDPLRDWVDIYSEPAYYLEQIGTLSPAQRRLVGVTWMQSEVNNGGFDQFFLNSTGIVASEALEGLKLFGAKEVESSLARIMAAFSGGAPSREHAKRNEQMEARWKGKLIDDEFKVPWRDMEKLDSLMAKYIREHPDEFFRPAKK